MRRRTARCKVSKNDEQYCKDVKNEKKNSSKNDENIKNKKKTASL